jgi:hypothetical protein
MHPGSKTVRSLSPSGGPGVIGSPDSMVSLRWIVWLAGTAPLALIRLASGVRTRRADVPRQGEDPVRWLAKERN